MIWTGRDGERGCFRLGKKFGKNLKVFEDKPCGCPWQSKGAARREVAGWGGGGVAAAGTLKAVLGSRHAYQRNRQPAKPWRGPPSCEDWVPRAEKGLECCTTSSWAHCLTHSAQWRFIEGEEEGRRCLLGGVWETSTLLTKEDVMTRDAGFRGSSWSCPQSPCPSGTRQEHAKG